MNEMTQIIMVELWLMGIMLGFCLKICIDKVVRKR